MSVFDRLQSTEVSPKTAALCISILAVVALAVILVVKNKVSSPPDRIELTSSSKVETKAKPTKSDKSGGSDSQAEVKSEHPLDAVFERDIFKPITGLVDSSAEKKTVAQAGPQIPAQIPPMPPMGMFPPPGGGGLPNFPGFGRGRSSGDGGKGIAFTGVVETPDGVQALLENTATSESTFAGVGDQAFGMQVLEINRRQVTLDSGGQEIRLSIGENKPDAPPAGAPPGPPGAQPPGADAPPQGAPGMAPGMPGMGPGMFPGGGPQNGPGGGWGRGRRRGQR